MVDKTNFIIKKCLVNPFQECLEVTEGMIAHPKDIEYCASVWFAGALGSISLPGFEWQLSGDDLSLCSLAHIHPTEKKLTCEPPHTHTDKTT